MSLPPASAACFLPPPEPVCFSSRTIASHRGSHPREVLFCPLPCTAMPRSPLGDAVGSWTPGGQAGSSDAGISSALAPRSVGGTPGARPGRGLWKALCLSWPLCLLPFAPPPPTSPGWVWAETWWGRARWGEGLGEGSAGFSRWPPTRACLEQNRCSLRAPAALPHAGSTPSSLFYFLLVSSSDSS